VITTGIARRSTLEDRELDGSPRRLLDQRGRDRSQDGGRGAVGLGDDDRVPGVGRGGEAGLGPVSGSVYPLMFSTTPSTGTPTRSNMRAPRNASPTAISCGVVTMSAPETWVD
jgi:hypothetical protein